MKPDIPIQHLRVNTRPAAWALVFIAAFLGGFVSTADAQTNYRVIKVLDGLSNPTALIEGNDGALYGTMEAGGAPEGVVFKLNKDGSGWSVLHGFGGAARDGDGAEPQGLMELSDGVLYGTTRSGGRPGRSRGLFDYTLGCGTIFRLNKDGSGYSVLYRFGGDDGDGASPVRDVVEGRDKALYGVTSESGPDPTKTGYGILFRLQKDGSGYAVLHRFGLSAGDGGPCFAGVVLGSNGSLFGTTDGGGAAEGRNGTVFSLNADGSTYKVLHSFPQTPFDGRMPRGRLLEGNGGTVCGTTQNGGTNDGGTVFKLNQDGSGYEVLHRFTTVSGQQIADPDRGLEAVIGGVRTKLSWTGGDGANPQDLIEGHDGALYGTTQNGGRHGGGTVFKLNKEGSNFTVLRSFSIGDSAGAEPARLVEARDGGFYGITRGCGTRGRVPIVFKLSVSEARPTSPPTAR